MLHIDSVGRVDETVVDILAQTDSNLITRQDSQKLNGCMNRIVHFSTSNTEHLMNERGLDDELLWYSPDNSIVPNQVDPEWHNHQFNSGSRNVKDADYIVIQRASGTERRRRPTHIIHWNDAKRSFDIVAQSHHEVMARVAEVRSLIVDTTSSFYSHLDKVLRYLKKETILEPEEWNHVYISICILAGRYYDWFQKERAQYIGTQSINQIMTSLIVQLNINMLLNTQSFYLGPNEGIVIPHKKTLHAGGVGLQYDDCVKDIYTRHFYIE